MKMAITTARRSSPRFSDLTRRVPPADGDRTPPAPDEIARCFVRRVLARAIAKIHAALTAAFLIALAIIGCLGPPSAHPVAERSREPTKETAMAKPDYSTLDLKGNGHTQDSFSLAVQAAAKLLGRDVDYEAIYCVSSNAFAPAIDRGENCTAWWHVQGWQADRCIETVAAAVGLRAEPLDLPPYTLSPKDPKEVFERKTLEHRKASARIVRARMAAGAIVLTAGGWKVRTEEGFAPWCWWGIVTDATDDGDLRGACLGAEPDKATGFRHRPLDFLGACWVLSPGPVTIGNDEVRRTALRQAVARIRGRGLFEAGGRSVYGLDAMDAWIAQMEKVPFCTSCAHAGPDGMAGCAANNVQTTRAGAGAAASYLRRSAPEFPEAARPHLETAAKRYDRIVELLKPATWGFYRKMLNDPEKQKVHAENLLVPVRAEFAAAAEAMEKALAATLAAEFPDDQKKRLRQWGNLFGFQKALEAAEKDPVFYELLRAELALEAVSESARLLRNAMGRIEPAELAYPAQLDAVFQALCSGEVSDDIVFRGGFDGSSPLWDQRKAQRREHAKHLREWIDDGSGALAGTLGKRSGGKLRLAKLTLHELEANGPDAKAIEELRADPDLRAFAHRIEMLDGELWSHERNFDLLMRSIAGLRPIGQWHTRNGPLAWGDAEPAARPEVEAMLAKLGAWLAGGEDAELGAPDAYPEKVWLARCLATYLRYHLRDCWDWMDRWGAERTVLNGREYELRWVSPDNLEEQQLVGDDRIPPRAPKSQYGHHAHPLHNIHCEVRPARPFDELRRELQREGKSWDELWRELAGRLDMDYLALIAIADGQLAGHVRFLPADKGQLRWVWVPEARQTDRRDILLISAGYVDADGAEAGLDVELLRRVSDYARDKGYTALRALGWSNIRAFAMWGETFPVSCFEELGFRKIDSVSGAEDALDDMLGGGAFRLGPRQDCCGDGQWHDEGAGDGALRRRASPAAPAASQARRRTRLDRGCAAGEAGASG